jgi:hypothetical protein
MEEQFLSPVEELNKDKLEGVIKCFSELEGYKQNKLNLQYPTFFVPGWTGENCAAWKEPYLDVPKQYKDYYRPIMQWINEIIENNSQAFYITFTEEETESSSSFLELGKYLKNKILTIVQDSPVNLVGHSMGGLDIRVAICDDEKTILNVKNVITVGTPNNGTPEAGLLGWRPIQKLVNHFKKMEPYHIKQGYNLYANSEPIKTINKVENRLKLLQRINKFYIFMGLLDSTVKGSPKLDKDGISEELYKEKVKTPLQTASAEHTGKAGITQDPRIVLPLIKILCGIELVDNFNYGYVFRKDGGAST